MRKLSAVKRSVRMLPSFLATTQVVAMATTGLSLLFANQKEAWTSGDSLPVKIACASAGRTSLMPIRLDGLSPLTT